MNHAEIVATYSNAALAGIIRDLTRIQEWYKRLQAAKLELERREIHNQQQDKDTLL